MVVANILKAAVVVAGVVLILLFIMTITNDDNEHQQFETFITRYNKSYVNETERGIRFKRFQVRLYYIRILCNTLEK